MSDSGDWWLNGMEHRMESHLENKANWDVAHGWGDHSIAGYLTSYIETDPIFLAWDKSAGITITENQISDLQSYLTVETDPVFTAWDKSTGISIIESQISNLHAKYTNAEAVAAIKADADWNASNWDAAYVWGNHSGLYDALGTAVGLVLVHEANYNHVNYNSAYTHSQNNSQAHSDYLKNDADDTTTGRLTAAGVTSTVNVITGILESATGPLKIQAGAVDDVVLFSSADVGDADDGKELKIWRNAPEGNSYIRTYINSVQNALIHSNTSIVLQNAAGNNIQLNSGQHIYLNLGDQIGNDEVKIRDAGGLEVGVIDSNGNVWFRGDVSIGVASDVLIQANGGSYFNGGPVGIGTTIPGLPLEVRSADDNQAIFFDSRAQVQGVGGGIAFGGKYNDAGDEAMAGRIGTEKTNGTSGHVGFDMIFETQDSVGSITERIKFTSDAKTIVRGELTVEDDILVAGIVDGRDVAADGTKLDGIATGAEVATKEFFISAGEAILSSNASYDTPNNMYQVSLADGVTFARCFFVFHLPGDFSSLVSGYPKVIFKQGTGGTGNYRIAFNGRAGGAGESMGGSLDSIVEYTMAGPGNTNLWEEDISANFDDLSLVAGDYVGLQIQRDSDDSLDTFIGKLDVVGVVVKYS